MFVPAYLSSELEPVATSLVKMYLALFVASVDAGDLQTKLLAALLMGVARVLPRPGKVSCALPPKSSMLCLGWPTRARDRPA